MQKTKSLISFLLIFAYSFGFVHNLIPHCEIHTEHSADIIEHHDKHHFHHEGEEVDNEHSHVVHNDHFDDNFLDYLLCALENANHHDDGCNLEFYTQTTDFENIEKFGEKSVDYFTFQSCFVEKESNTSKRNNAHVGILYLSEEFVALCPHRGPPLHNS